MTFHATHVGFDAGMPVCGSLEKTAGVHAQYARADMFDRADACDTCRSIVQAMESDDWPRVESLISESLRRLEQVNR